MLASLKKVTVLLIKKRCTWVLNKVAVSEVPVSFSKGPVAMIMSEGKLQHQSVSILMST